MRARQLPAGGRAQVGATNARFYPHFPTHHIFTDSIVNRESAGSQNFVPEYNRTLAHIVLICRWSACNAFYKRIKNTNKSMYDDGLLVAANHEGAPYTSFTADSEQDASEALAKLGLFAEPFACSVIAELDMKWRELFLDKPERVSYIGGFLVPCKNNDGDIVYENLFARKISLADGGEGQIAYDETPFYILLRAISYTTSNLYLSPNSMDARTATQRYNDYLGFPLHDNGTQIPRWLLERFGFLNRQRGDISRAMISNIYALFKSLYLCDEYKSAGFVYQEPDAPANDFSKIEEIISKSIRPNTTVERMEGAYRAQRNFANTIVDNTFTAMVLAVVDNMFDATQIMRGEEAARRANNRGPGQNQNLDRFFAARRNREEEEEEQERE